MTRRSEASLIKKLCIKASARHAARVAAEREAYEDALVSRVVERLIALLRPAAASRKGGKRRAIRRPA